MEKLWDGANANRGSLQFQDGREGRAASRKAAQSAAYVVRARWRMDGVAGSGIYEAVKVDKDGWNGEESKNRGQRRSGSWFTWPSLQTSAQT